MRRLLITNDESGGTVLNGRPARKIKLNKLMFVMLLLLADMFHTDAFAQVAAVITSSGTTSHNTVAHAVSRANSLNVDCEVKILTSCTSDPLTIENANGKVITLNTGDAGTVLTITATSDQEDLINAKTSLDLKGNGGMVIADINGKTYVNAVHAGSNQVTVRMYDGFVLKTINGGMEARMLAIYEGSKCYIYGGCLICPKGAEEGVNHNLSTIVNVKSYVYIYGGEFHWDVKGDHSWYPYWAGVLDSADAIEFIIYGGYFDGPLWWASSSTAQKYIFYGGKYTTNKLKNNYYQKEGSIDWTDYLGEGRTANNITESYNGTTYYYEIECEESPVAININRGINYNTVQTAVDNAQAGNTIRMLKNSTENVTVSNNITLDLNGNTLTAQNTSGTVITNNGTLTLTDAVGGGNITSGAKGVMQNGTMTVGGKLNITGNTANVYLPNGKTITVSSTTPLIDGANIGVTTATLPTVGSPVAITSNGASTDVQYFTADDNTYVVSYRSGHLDLAIPVCENTSTHVKYATVQEAINAAENGNTIQMLANSTENVTIPNGKDITLKLNGKVLTAKNTSGTVITNNGTLTLTDSDGGNVTGGAKGVEQNGTMTVGGKLNITGNTADFYLSANNTVAVSLDTPLVNGANIRVTTETTPTGSSPVAITSNRGEDYGYFTSAAGYFVTNIDGVVKDVLQYTIHFRKGSNNVTCGGEPFNDKDVTMTYGGSTADVPVLEKAGNTFIGWNTSNLASAAQYQTADLNTICSQHGGEVDLYPVWAINTGVPVNVALDNGSDIPAIGRKYTFNIEAITEGAPMPAATTLQLNAPTAAGEANKVGYDASSLDNPWRMSLPKGVYSYVITQTNDAQEAETMDEGSWTMTFDVDPYSDTPKCETTFSQYKSKVDPMTINSFYIVKADNNVAADVTVDGQGRTRLVLGGNKVVEDDAFNTAVIKGKFEIDFDRNFTATGSLTLPPSATPDGTLVGFIANPTVPQSSHLEGGGSLGILFRSEFSNGVVLEFDPYDNGSSHADPDYKHFTLETLNGNASPTAVEHWNMNNQWPTGSCSYTIDNDIKNNKLTFTVTLPGGASKTYTYNDPKSAFGTNVSKAYLIMSGVVRYGEADTYGLGEVGSTAPSLTMYFDSFYYYGQKEGFVEQSIFVNKLDHVWQYTAEGNVLKAQCKHDFSDETLTTHCMLPGVKNLTVTSYSKNYDGGSCQAAEYTTDQWTEIGLEKPTIKYSGVSPTTYDETTSTPCTFGKYQATAKMGDNVAASPFVIRPQIYCTTADAVHGSVAITDKTTDTVIASGSFIEPYQEIILTATAVGHWHFTNWTNGTTVVGTDNPWTFLMNENVKNYTANFAIDKHTVTAMPNVQAFGSVSIQDVTPKNGDGVISETFDYGTKVQLTATPTDKTYTFLYWTKVSDTTAVISTDNEFKFTLEQDTTFKAIFVNEVQVNIEATPMDGGEVTIKNNETGEYLTPEQAKHILYGTSVTIEATPTKDWAFKGWFIKGTETLFCKTQTYTFNATTLKLDLEARFTNQVIWVRVKKGN